MMRTPLAVLMCVSLLPGVAAAQTTLDSVRARSSGDQSLPSGAWTFLSLNVEDFDTNALHDNSTNNSRLTAKTAGKYLVGGTVMVGATGGTQMGVGIFKNGGYVTDNRIEPQAGFGNKNTIVTFLDMAVNDYVQLAVFHQSGSNVDAYGDGYTPLFWMFRVPDATAGSSQWTTSGSTISYSAGNVGIGTTSPGYRFDVQGGAINASGGLCIAGDCKTSWPQSTGSSPWTVNGTAVGYTAGNVGVGTASPAAKLHVTGTTRVDSTLLSVNGVASNTAFFDMSATDPLLVLRSGAGGLNPALQFQVLNANTGAVEKNATIDGNGSTGFYLQADRLNLPIVFRTNSGPDPVDRMQISGNGNVGIGTSAPTAKLHVEGDVFVSGNIAAKYQDVAEWVDTTGPLPAGTVVITDDTAVNRVRPSTSAYDTSVAGVVSAQPGVLLGQAGEGRAAVAQSGRVKVKVDASYGAIKQGDVLVTSPREGYAMKSQPVMVGDVPMHRPGTILGKALEPLPNGEGEILVLLTLQ